MDLAILERYKSFPTIIRRVNVLAPSFVAFSSQQEYFVETKPKLSSAGIASDITDLTLKLNGQQHRHVP